MRSTSKSFDERDTLFARIRLEKGSDRYRQYYRDKESLRKKDDPLREPDFVQNLKESESFKQKHLPRIEDFDEKALRLHEETMRIHPEDTRANVTTEEIFAVAKKSGASDVASLVLEDGDTYTHHGGVSAIRPGYGHGEPIRADFPRVLVFTVRMDTDLLAHAPRFEALYAAKEAYYRVAETGARIVRYLKKRGYRALFTGEHHYVAPLVPLAEKAHLGQRGMMHVLVHPEQGPSIRLGTVFTDAPLEERKKRAVDIKEFCKRCALCLMNCPTGAIKPFSRGRPVFDEHRCFRMFIAYGTDCGICLKSCPFAYGVDTARLEEGRETLDGLVKEHLDKHGRIPKPVKPSPFRNDEE